MMQKITLADLIGKTIAKQVIEDYDMFIFFTDGTFIHLEAEYDDTFGSRILEVADVKRPRAELAVELGIMTAEEKLQVDDLRREEEAKAHEKWLENSLKLKDYIREQKENSLSTIMLRKAYGSNVQTVDERQD